MSKQRSREDFAKIVQLGELILKAKLAIMETYWQKQHFAYSVPYMRNFLIVGCYSSFLLCTAILCFGDDSMDADTDMMKDTFKIESGSVIGTGFFVGETITNHQIIGTGQLVLVTAAHVLSGMPSTNATLLLRIRNGTDSYTKFPYTIQIRANGRDLWTRHPQADVAVMRISANNPMPGEVDLSLFSDSSFADDAWLEKFRIHPGDELRVLGYPLGAEANASGFAILRSGRIASYPIIPAATVQTFLLDFPIFKGNSGGPVYMCERRYMHDGSNESVTVFKIMGLISEEGRMDEQITSMDETTVKTHALGIGVVVNAEVIKETLKLLPPQ